MTNRHDLNKGAQCFSSYVNFAPSFFFVRRSLAMKGSSEIHLFDAQISFFFHSSALLALKCLESLCERALLH